MRKKTSAYRIDGKTWDQEYVRMRSGRHFENREIGKIAE